MLLTSRRLYYLCATMLVSLAYIGTSNGQTTNGQENGTDITTQLMATTTVELTTVPATTKTPPTTSPTTTTLLPDLNEPENVRLEELPSDNTAFNVTWDHDVDGRLNVTYNINVTPTDGSEGKTVTNVMSVATITGQTPGQEYNVTVVAIDEANNRTADSEVTTIRLTPNQVTNLTRKDSSSTTVQAKWNRPSDEVSGYTVSCSLGSPSKAEITDADETEASCSSDDIDDIAGKEVIVTVVTNSGNKSSVPANVTIPANPNPVENLMESDADTLSVTATWQAPSVGDVDNYEVICSGEGTPSPVTNNGNQYEASCTEIKAGDNITVTVSSISNNVTSTPKSVPIIALPNPVVLEESGATIDSVTVNWTKPEDIFDSYVGNCSEGSLDAVLTQDSTSATCTGVTAGNVVTVTIFTISGDKNSSDDLNVIAVPNAVGNLMGQDATTSSVTVRWTTPGGDFSSYEVTCSDGVLSGTLTRDSTEATCKDVMAGNMVSVTVDTISGTISGNKTNSDSTTVTALPYMVLNLTEIDATMESIVASWQFPGGIVSTYKVSCSNGTANPADVFENNSNEYSSTCENLSTPGDNYTMTVTSLSGDVFGAPDTVQITAVPSSPELKGLPPSVENVNASWSHPLGIVDFFEVTCEPEEISTPVEKTIDADGSTFEAACTVDTPGELYNLSVTSVSGGKRSAVSTEPLRACVVFKMIAADMSKMSWNGMTGKLWSKTPEALEQVSVQNYSTDDLTLICNAVEGCQNDGCIWDSLTMEVESDKSDPNEIDVYEDNTTDANLFLITNLIPGKCYNFSCIFLNNDTETSRGSIHQCTLPEAVYNFTVEKVTTDMVQLQWTMKKRCEHGGCIWSSFNVSVNPGFLEKNVSLDERSTNFTQLKPGEYYNFSIAVMSQEETSLPRTVSLQTIPEAVKEFIATSNATSSVWLEWTIEDICKIGRCVWDAYDVSYTSSDGPINQTSFQKNVSSAEISDLTPGESYNFSITVVSGEKRSAARNVVQQTLPEAVKDFIVTSSSTSSVWLEWTIEDICKNGGCVWDAYDVSYTSSDGSTINQTFQKNISSAEISDLTPGESYNFSLTVVSGEKRSAVTNFVQQTLPEAVKEFIVTSSSTSSVWLEWTIEDICENDGCVWDAYDVSFTSLDGTINQTSFQKNVSSAKISNLTPGENYNFSIIVVSGEKRSVARNVVQRTLPEAVKVFIATSNATNSVWLEWTIEDICENDGCVWDAYDVSYTSLDGTINQTSFQENVVSAKISALTPGESYNFSITVVSGEERSAVTNVVQRTLPEAVGSFRVEDVSTDTVELQWTIKSRCQDDGCVWSSFNVSHTPDYFEKNVLKNERSTTFSSLTPGESYTFNITVLSENEESEVKTVVERTIPETVDNFNVSDYSTNFVDLYWTIKDSCKNDSCVWDSYNLTYTSDRDPSPRLWPLLDLRDVLTTRVDSLTPGENYYFNVTVVSGQKESSPEKVEQRTIPESVERFEVSSYSTDTANLNWTIRNICEGDGCVWDRYTISYTSSDGMETESLSKSKESLSTEIGNLTPGESYDFFITVLSGDEESSNKTDTQRTSPESVEELNVTSYSTDSVSLNWTVKDICDSGGCVWDGYNISLYTSSSDTKIDSFQESEDSLSRTIDNLTPGESYDFFITVLSGNEKSSDETVTQRTLPEAVDTFQVDSYSNSNVNLSWAMTERCLPIGGCVWTSFNLTYNSTEAQDIREESDIPEKSRTFYESSLTPGAEYDFSISVISYDKSSDPNVTTQRLRPDDVGELRVPENFTTQTRVVWDRPSGILTSYDTTISGLDGYSASQNVDVEEVTYTGLTPGEYYTVTVCTRSYEQQCIHSSSISLRIIPVLSTPPTRLVLEAISISEVRVTFQEPEEPNGVIVNYIINYSGTKEGADSNPEPGEIETEELTVTVSDLWPGYTYTFSVSAVNEAGEGDPAEETITLGEEEPVESTVSPVVLIDTSRTNINSFIVAFSSDWFSHCNGELENFSVFVVQEGGNKTIGNPPRSYKDVQNEKTLSVYQAIADRPYPFPPELDSCGSSRKRRATTSPVMITIGNETCRDEKYCNGPLRGNREYRVKYRACNSVGCSETPYSDKIKTDLNPVSWWLPLLFIFLILIVALVIAAVWKERKQPGFVTKYLPNRGHDNPAFTEDKPMRKTGNKRPVKLAEFGQYLEEMSRDSDYLFSEEYNDLRPVGKEQSTDAAQLEVNRVKNRFSNILPYDHTRVSLSPIDDEEGSDYINANYMLGYNSQREYVACQGPLQSTEEDMWRLVWEQGASIIVMVTQLMENGKIKCHQYWPDEGEGPVRYGEIVVNPIRVSHEPLWTIRKFQLTKGPTSRTITHFNFMAWPDHGVPERPDDLIKFVQVVRDCKKSDGKPTVVHCSAGVGRTGTFISLDNLMNAMKENDEIDIFGMVRSMRMNRCMMVQTESQYIFIHQCVMALLEGSDSDALYENVNGNGYFNEALI